MIPNFTCLRRGGNRLKPSTGPGRVVVPGEKSGVLYSERTDSILKFYELTNYPCTRVE